MRVPGGGGGGEKRADDGSQSASARVLTWDNCLAP